MTDKQEGIDVDWSQKFHDHLDECVQCRESPFSLCASGSHYLKMAALKKAVIKNGEPG